VKALILFALVTFILAFGASGEEPVPIHAFVGACCKEISTVLSQASSPANCTRTAFFHFPSSS
jgi:hypothetical protein